MVCLPCKFAGSAITAKKRGEIAAYDVLGLMALHRQCEQPKTCACQHRVINSAINKGQPT